jgi:hypothetical protein
MHKERAGERAVAWPGGGEIEVAGLLLEDLTGQIPE